MRVRCIDCNGIGLVSEQDKMWWLIVNAKKKPQERYPKCKPCKGSGWVDNPDLREV